jgi:hypothetical protein
MKSKNITKQKFLAFGIRDTSDMERDVFNDKIGCIVNDEECYICTATTDPGMYWQNKPMNPKGTAHLVLGFHEGLFKTGVHGAGKRYEHKAFVQSSPCTVKRYKSYADYKAEKYMLDRGIFGINLHSTIGATPQEVGNWSAGCQVIQRLEDLNEMLVLYKQSGHIGAFNYILFDKSEILV